MKSLLLVAASAFAVAGVSANAQDTKPPVRDSAAKIQGVSVSAQRDPKPTLTRLTLPSTATVTARDVNETVNIVDSEDAVKYLPSLFLRKRNYGDTQAVMGTRVWGVSSSARSLVFADGVPITALIANNNNIGAPRWGLVASEEIERVDVMYGPFSAAYAGNSMGAVLEITTRMPDKFVGSLSYTGALQDFSLYGTKSNFGMSQGAATVGNRFGKFSFWASGNYQDSNSQPLTYVTSATFPTGTTGGFAETNKLGASANVLGASGLLHTRMTNAKIKAAYDITPTVRAAYTLGFWNNDADATADPYIVKADAASYAGVAGFASGTYHLQQQHYSHSLSVRSDTRKDWDFDLVGTLYRIDKDVQRSPTTALATGTAFGSAGRVATLSGSNWKTFDARAAWHPGGLIAENIVSFGVHADEYKLLNPTYNTPDWTTGASHSSVASEGDGNTRTLAVWAQDSWRILPTLKLTVGGRYEDWRAFAGYNANGTTQVTQKDVGLRRFSPKGVLNWMATPDWTFTASVAKAYRFATAAELYQLVTTGVTFTSPDPNLKPDNVLSTELRVERAFTSGRLQVSLFNDDVHDAIISQYKPLVPGSAMLYSFASNVDRVRARGIEAVASTHLFGIRGLDVSATGTYLDATTQAITGQASATATPGSAIGKFLPNIPKWRANYLLTYRPVERLALTTGGRYSSLLYTTLDDADVNPNTYQGFSEWFVADAHVSYSLKQHWSASLGADNMLNRKYFLFHPFQQRTLVTSLKYSF
jgi:iron complex outermembrane receptor protein